MAEFTKERLEQFINKPLEHGLTSGEQMEMARQILASMEHEPVAYACIDGDGVEYNGHNEFSGGGKGVTLYAAPQLPQPAVPEPQPEHLLPQGSSRDAIRYQFLRDKDAFGNENEPGLAGWDDLAELEGDAFDAAVDARMADADIPAYNTPQEPEVKADAEIYAELYRLRAEIKGPDGFDTWKDAAISEKKARIACEKRVPEIDYLTAMGAFHSDEWHKMGPISGYMKGWNARCAAMLQGAEPVQEQNQTAGSAYKCRSSEKVQVLQDGWVAVPVEPTEKMVIEGFESVPHPLFQPADWDKYQTMSGCEQAAHRAKLCWAAMIKGAPKP